MLVELDSKIEAQRAVNVGFKRAGEKAVQCHIDDYTEIRDTLDDVTITKCSLERRNSEREASIIDECINAGYEGTVHQVTGLYTKTGARNHTPTLREQTDRLFSLGADSMTIYRDFDAVLNGEVTEVAIDPATFDDNAGQVADGVQDQIDALHDEIEALEAFHDELVELSLAEWVEQGMPTLEP